MRKTVMLGAICATVISAVPTLAACGGDATPDRARSSDHVTASEDPEQSKSDTPNDSDVLNVGLNETARWGNGTTARLSDFRTGTTSGTDIPSGVRYISFTVTIKAGGQIIDLDGTIEDCPVGGGTVYTDTLPSDSTGHILAGDSRTLRMGCVTTRDNKIQVEVTPVSTGNDDYWYDTAVFTGTS